MRVIEDKRVLDGGMDIKEMFSCFDIKYEPDEGNCADTLGAWVIDEFGEMPQEGDGFAYGNLLVTVTKTEFRHVTEVEIECVSPIDAEAE